MAVGLIFPPWLVFTANLPFGELILLLLLLLLCLNPLCLLRSVRLPYKLCRALGAPIVVCMGYIGMRWALSNMAFFDALVCFHMSRVLDGAVMSSSPFLAHHVCLSVFESVGSLCDSGPLVMIGKTSVTVCPVRFNTLTVRCGRTNVSEVPQ